MAVRTEKRPGKDLRVDLTYVEICRDVVRNSFPQKKCLKIWVEESL